MNPKQFLAGEDLEQIYLSDKSSDLFKDPENLKILLNYALNKKEKMNSNSNMEMIDFCVERLEPHVPIDEERIAFMIEKQEFMARQREKKRRFYSIGKMAAAAAVFVVVAGTAVLGNTKESEAGVFDWIRSLITSEKAGGEQLSFHSPDATMMAYERKEGHLPDYLPEQFVFESSNTVNTAHVSWYIYEFKDKNSSNILSIQIAESTDFQNLINTELEIEKDSLKTVEDHGITYYYSMNKEENCISWVYDEKIYKIHGNFTLEKLDTVLSLYQKEQT